MENSEDIITSAIPSTQVHFGMDENGVVSFITNGISEWGYSPEELNNKPFTQFIEPTSAKAFAEYFVGPKNTKLKEFRCKLIQRNVKIGACSLRIEWVDQLNIFHCTVSFLKHKRFDRGIALKSRNLDKTAQKLDEILENMQDGFFAMDRKWRVTYYNNKAAHLTGKRRDEVLGKVFWEVFPSAVNTIAYAKYQSALSKQVQTSFELYSPLYKGWFDVVAYPSNKGLSVFFKNITERKKNEEQAMMVSQRYQWLAKATSDAVWDLDVDANSLYLNESFKLLFGYDYSDKSSIDIWTSHIHEQDREAVLESVKSALANSSVSHWVQEYKFYHVNESVANILHRGFIIRNDIGAAIRMVGSMQDITKIRDAEEEVRNLSLIAKETSNAVVITDVHEQIIWVNKAFTSITEYEFSEVIGKRPGELLQGARTSQKAKRYMREKIALGEPFACDIINYSKTGREYWMDVKVQPLFDGQGNVKQFFSIQTDITERIELQRLVVNEHIDASRKMTQVIIETQEKERSEIGKELHDNVTQLLATINLYLGCIENHPEDRATLITKCKELTNFAISETRDLSHHLITPIFGELQFRESIDQLLGHYRNMQIFDVSLEFTIAEEKFCNDIKLTIYRIIQEAVNNVVKYANATRVYIGLLDTIDHIQLIVHDNGEGFDISKINGGIGISNIQNRARLYNGDFQLKSQPGVGTKLVINFPKQLS